MTTDPLRHFRSIQTVDFEFHQPGGELPRPICMVARELRTGREIRLWEDQLVRVGRPPFSVDSECLFVCYSAPAEISCFLVLDWPLPTRVLDLYVEYRAMRNGFESPGYGLLAAAKYFGLDCIDAAEKTRMRDLAIRGGPFNDREKEDLLEYCADDVALEEKLLTQMVPHIHVPHALFRGRFQTAVARMEANGVPLDTSTLTLLRKHWDGLKLDVIGHADSRYGVYEGTKFKHERFARYLAERNISWPLTQRGRLKTDRDTFKEMARVHPELAPLRELKHSLDELKLESLQVGHDGRNRVSLMPFASRTGRNQPSNSQFIFGPAVWLRGLIKPLRGRFVCYADWSGQEYGIAAYLSGDIAMIEDGRNRLPANGS